MQTKEPAQGYEYKRNEVSYLENVYAAGDTTPCSPYIEIMHQKTTEETKTNEGKSKYLHSANQVPRHQ